MTQTDLATSGAASASDALETAPRLGRRRDPSRDTDILEAAIDVLAEVGYEGMTVEMVAARAKAGKATLYRRWPSKADLVLDAVACLKGPALDPALLPDTGTLRGDLVALIQPPNLRDADRKTRIMSGIVSLVSQDPGFAEAARRALVEPRIQANRILLERAVARGEISAELDLDLIARISPSMVVYRTLMLGEPIDRAFLERVIDRVVLPAAGVRG